MRTQAHRIVDTDPKRGTVVVRVTGTRHDEPTYQVRQSLPNTQEVPGHDHHTNRVREPGQAPTGLSCDLYPLIGSHSTWTDPRGPVKGSAGSDRGVDDTWIWSQETERVYQELVQGGAPVKVADALEAMRKLLGDNDVLSYLTMMSARLVELHRVLKPTG